MKLLSALFEKISRLKSAKTDYTAQQEVAVMVNGGDIYTVLVRDRAARRMDRADGHRSDSRRDATWPFIR